MSKYLAILFLTMFAILVASGVVMAMPHWVEIDVSSIPAGTGFELDVELYNNNYYINGQEDSSRVGDSYVLIDDVYIKDANGDVVTPPWLIDFESGGLDGFDDSLSSGYITVVDGTQWSGTWMMRMDEDPNAIPTLTWRGFMPSGAQTLVFEFEFVGSSVPGDPGLDAFVAKLLDENLAPFSSIPELTTGQGDFLAVDSSGMRMTAATASGPAVVAHIADGPYKGTPGVGMTFDGSGSFVADGSPLVSYSWFLGDGGTATGMNPTYTYNAAGVYTVMLIVNDGAHDSPPATTTAVINTPPVADANGPYTGLPGQGVQFDGSGSYDPDGGALSYLWDFDDGNTSTEANPTHTYAAIGTYTVTLIVNDGIDDSELSTTTAVINTPPVADARVVTEEGKRVVGQPIQFDGSSSYDADGDTLSYLWDFDDGNTSTEVNPTHTYATAGTYAVTLIVNDGKMDSDPSTVDVEIKPELELVAVFYDILNTTLILRFNRPVLPKPIRFDGIGMEVDNSDDWDFAMSDIRGLSANQTVPSDEITINISRDHVTTVNLAVAALIDRHRVDILLEPGVFTDEYGNMNPAVMGTNNVKVQMIANGLSVGTVGDVTGDGQTTAYDAALILKSTVDGLFTLPIYNTASELDTLLAAYGYPDEDVLMDTADVDRSKELSSYDASLVLMKSAGIINLAPVSSSSTRICKLNVSDYNNQRLDVSIGLDDVSDIYSADIVMTYDPQALTLADVSRTSSTPEWLSEQGAESGQLRISLAGAHQPAANGSIVTINFDVVNTRFIPTDAIRKLDITELKLNGGRVKATIENLPKAFALLQNYPNPFNPETWIPYRLSEAADVTVTIYNVSGQMVRRLELGYKMPGHYVDTSRAAYWDGRNEVGEEVSSGVYFYQLWAGQDASVRKMIIVK